MRHKKAAVRVRRYLTLDCELEQRTVQPADWQDSEQLLAPIFLRTCFDALLRKTYGERESANVCWHYRSPHQLLITRSNEQLYTKLSYLASKWVGGMACWLRPRRPPRS